MDDYKTVVAREDATATTNADETGWETEEEEDDNEDEEDSEEDMEASFIDPWGPDPSGLYHDKLFCERCEEYHRPAPKYCPVVRDLQPSTPSVHQLALTCKFLRKLALPYIYESVDFETLSNEVMERYLEVIVPKYGQHVKDVSFHTAYSYGAAG